MRRAPKLCPKCPRLQPCPQHVRVAWQRAPRRTPYNAAHVRLRKLVLREQPICYICRVLPSVTLDHITPLYRGGHTVRSNVAGACERCQRAKAAREGVEARQATR